MSLAVIPSNCSTGNYPAPTLTAGAIAGSDTGIVLASTLDSSPIQPVADVVKYLATRKPQPDYKREYPLFITLPDVIKAEVTELYDACARVAMRVVGPEKMKVTPAIGQVLTQPRFAKLNWKVKTFRAIYDEYTDQGDWLCLVNRSKCDARWKKTNVGLAEQFVDFVATHYIARYAREDGKRQAIIALHRHWKTGRNQFGEEVVIPGYEDGWKKRTVEIVPEGWTYWNIMRQIKAREKFGRAEQAMLHNSTAAAKEFLPQHATTREGMRFMQEITFDDLRFDFLILNTDTGQAEELWALIARDTATGVVLGGVLYPASVREDGTVSHLGARQMKELAGQLLETYPLPPYLVTWKVERGTATLATAVKEALAELFGNRIKVSYTSMIGNKSPVGYAEKKKGNSRGKASHESHNRLFHTQGSTLPGQTGSSYDIRPADLKARCEEAQQIWRDAQSLPAHLQSEVRYPLLTLARAREKFREFSLQQNFRDDHKMEGFEQVLEWLNPVDGKLYPADSVPPGAKIISRMERPVERAMRLIRQVPPEQWESCRPDIVVAFLEHTQKRVPINPKGEIVFDHEGKQLTFVNPGIALPRGTVDALVYFHAADPNYIHLTNGKGGVLGTWVRKARVRAGDREALVAAMRYTRTAQAAAEDRARQLAAPQIEELEALRAHNAKLAEFIDVTAAPAAGARPIAAPAGEALTTVSQAVKADAKRKKKQASDEAADAAAARATLLNSFR